MTAEKVAEDLSINVTSGIFLSQCLDAWSRELFSLRPSLFIVIGMAGGHQDDQYWPSFKKVEEAEVSSGLARGRSTIFEDSQLPGDPQLFEDVDDGQMVEVELDDGKDLEQDKVSPAGLPKDAEAKVKAKAESPKLTGKMKRVQSPKAKAKGKAKAQPKANKAQTPKAKAKGKAKAQPKATAKGKKGGNPAETPGEDEPAMKKRTGCNKRRWSKNGCGKCRVLKMVLEGAEADGSDNV